MTCTIAVARSRFVCVEVSPASLKRSRSMAAGTLGSGKKPCVSSVASPPRKEGSDGEGGQLQGIGALLAPTQEPAWMPKSEGITAVLICEASPLGGPKLTLFPPPPPPPPPLFAGGGGGGAAPPPPPPAAGGGGGGGGSWSGF